MDGLWDKGPLVLTRPQTEPATNDACVFVHLWSVWLIFPTINIKLKPWCPKPVQWCSCPCYCDGLLLSDILLTKSIVWLKYYLLIIQINLSFKKNNNNKTLLAGQIFYFALTLPSFHYIMLSLWGHWVLKKARPVWALSIGARWQQS